MPVAYQKRSVIPYSHVYEGMSRVTTGKCTAHCGCGNNWNPTKGVNLTRKSWSSWKGIKAWELPSYIGEIESQLQNLLVNSLGYGTVNLGNEMANRNGLCS